MIQYNPEYVAEWREKAVTKFSEFVEGQTYFSVFKGEFVFKSVSTLNEAHGRNSPDSFDNERSWIETKDGRVFSGHDENVEASYNPWLIFKSKEDCENYKQGLKTWYVDDDYVLDVFSDPHDYYDEDYRDYDEDYYHNSIED